MTMKVKGGIAGFQEAVLSSSIAKQQLSGKRVLEMLSLIRDPVSYVEREQKKKDLLLKQQQQQGSAANSATQQTTPTPGAGEGTVKSQAQPAPQQQSQQQQAQSAATVDTKPSANAQQPPKPLAPAAPNTNAAPAANTAPPSATQPNAATSSAAAPSTAAPSATTIPVMTIAQEVESLGKIATGTLVHTDATRSVYTFRYNVIPRLEQFFPRVTVTLPAGYPHSASATFTCEPASNDDTAAYVSRSTYEHVSRAMRDKVGQAVHRLSVIVQFCQQSSVQLLKRFDDQKRQAQLAAQQQQQQQQQQGQNHTTPQPQSQPAHEQPPPQQPAMVTG